MTVLTRPAHRSWVAFGRLAEATDSQNVAAFINRTDFEHEALLVFSRRFGGAGGEYDITAVRKRTATTWQIHTVRRPGPLQAESTGVLVVRINRTVTPLPDRLRVIHQHTDGARSNRTVPLP
ncbi:hypothetical protein [Halorarius halobius]|uniref:hypothetical protein n=1 Tax=Halorarius halobius TaxID=2962671 RepID=UPI0020CDCA22|nr:hypothetical protein [Halorarius halobius]